MCRTYHATGIDDGYKRHAAQLEEVDLLFIPGRDLVTRVGEADKGQGLDLPVGPEGCGRIGTDGKDVGAPLRELGVLVTQTRQLRAAVRSHKAAQERKQDRLATVIDKPHACAVRIGQFEEGSRFPGVQQFRHGPPQASGLRSRSSRTS